MGLLLIYDADDRLMRNTRRSADETVGVSGGVSGLISALDKLVSDGKKFSAAVFHTHGGAGYINFNGKTINTEVWNEKFVGRNYELLFPFYSRIYFDGCKIAAKDKGLDFLKAAGAVFLRGAGGEVFAHTTDGYPLAPILPTLLFGFWGFVGSWGHSYHSTAPRYVLIQPGGTVAPPGPATTPFPADDRVWKSSKF